MKEQKNDLNSKIWLSPPHMSGYEKKFINEAFETNWIAPLGTNIDGFEKDIEEYLESNHYVAALSSGTAAIHLALILLNVKNGDEVICQTKTFAASVNPVTYLGATPILVDSEEETWNICPKLLEKAVKDRILIGTKPKAIIAINLYGMPYNIEAISKISRDYQIPVIEDSAESIGSCYKGKKCGTFGDISIFSFNGNKLITTSAGGALISKDKNIRNRAVFLATQAKDKGDEYSHSEVGYNYRMSNVIAGIGRGQMKVLDKYVALRRRNYDYYFKHLSHYKDLCFLEEPANYFSNRWLTCIMLSSNEMRDSLRVLLKNNSIEARASWKPMHLQPAFNFLPNYINGTSERLYRNGLCLPSGSSLSIRDLEKIVGIIKSHLDNV